MSSLLAHISRKFSPGVLQKLHNMVFFNYVC